MARLYLFAEGQAEPTFANTVRCPHPAQRGVYLHKAVLVANSHKKHRTHRGGIRNFQAMQKDIIRFLRQHSGNDVFFTSMIDLYRLPEDFPGFKKADKRRRDPYGRVRMLEKRWAKETKASMHGVRTDRPRGTSAALLGATVAIDDHAYRIRDRSRSQGLPILGC